MAEKHTKSVVSNISGKCWEKLCMTGNEIATSDCLGGWISCLQLLHAFAIITNHASHVELVSPSGAASPKELWSVQQ